MLKKHMAAGKGRAIVNQGKGSQSQPLTSQNNLSQSGSDMPDSTMNNYAKATPMAQPAPPAPAPSVPQPAPPNTGLGSGTFPGVTG
ncbi:MAG TPA: hypothetical protein VMS08_00290 [Candidatus Saccharimonadia bacterium]|jgi:hypothetical protein|nr:hypothetical protein [Candidatus Saccharimonadia bacterium]